MSHGFGFNFWTDDVDNAECRFGIGEGGEGESRSVDLSVTLDVSDAAGWVEKGLVWKENWYQ